MTKTDAQIINLLNAGYSYAEIQDELQVSSKTIAAVKKTRFLVPESTADALSKDTFLVQSQPSQDIYSKPTQIKLLEINNQKTKKMKTDNKYYEDNDGITSNLELEKYRLKLTHDLEMTKIQIAREDKEREYALRENEIETGRRKAEEDKRSLLYRIKKVVDSCEDAQYSYEDAETLLEEARKVLSESEKYCFINQITFKGSISHALLSKIIETLVEFLEEIDEDESEDLEFDTAFRRQVSRATFQSF